MRPDLRAVRYSPRDDGTPEVELAALAACYRIIIESAKNRDQTPGAPRPQQKSGRGSRPFSECSPCNKQETVGRTVGPAFGAHHEC